MTPTLESRFRGCLLAGAVGDALGSPVEFMPLQGIVDRFGLGGPEDLADGIFPAGSFTDDTQMTLFVAEGLIRSVNQQRSRGADSDIKVMLRAHWRWLTTQGERPDTGTDSEWMRSWLTDVPGLNECRAPGNSCL